jgi:hypothetical protein
LKFKPLSLVSVFLFFPHAIVPATRPPERADKNTERPSGTSDVGAETQTPEGPIDARQRKAAANSLGTASRRLHLNVCLQYV